MRHAREDYSPIQDPRGQIPEDEPVFLIRGQDMVAPSVLRFYADQVESMNPRMATRVREWADEMHRWPKKKQPDAPEDAF